MVDYLLPAILKLRLSFVQPPCFCFTFLPLRGANVAVASPALVAIATMLLNVLTHQLLVYADDVNISGGSVHTIEQNRSFSRR
jgi:hypothetical protein